MLYPIIGDIGCDVAGSDVGFWLMPLRGENAVPDLPFGSYFQGTPTEVNFANL